jgi:hypothetical protein
MKKPEVADTFDVGALVGERRTLSRIAGGCSAADAQCMRKIRETKQYLSKAKTWDEFCPRYLGISRASADRLIRHLEEFGPESFEAMQQLGISSAEYRLLAPRLEAGELRHAGQAIALLPENGAKIHAALREIRHEKRLPAPAQTDPTDSSSQERLNTLARRCTEVVDEFRALYRSAPDDADRPRIDEMLIKTRFRMTRILLQYVFCTPRPAPESGS